MRSSGTSHRPSRTGLDVNVRSQIITRAHPSRQSRVRGTTPASSHTGDEVLTLPVLLNRAPHASTVAKSRAILTRDTCGGRGEGEESQTRRCRYEQRNGRWKARSMGPVPGRVGRRRGTHLDITRGYHAHVQRGAERIVVPSHHGTGAPPTVNAKQNRVSEKRL